jgi:hypothetical protein
MEKLEEQVDCKTTLIIILLTLCLVSIFYYFGKIKTNYKPIDISNIENQIKDLKKDFSKLDSIKILLDTSKSKIITNNYIIKKDYENKIQILSNNSLDESILFLSRAIAQEDSIRNR